MNLGELIKYLESLPGDAVARPGFGRPMSHRGDYSNVAFEPEDVATAAEMLAHARSAVGVTFPGYKGGEFKMGEWTDCYLAEYGRVGDALTELSLKAMFFDARALKLAAYRAGVEAAAKRFDGAVWSYDYRQIAESLRALPDPTPETLEKIK
jgi:hypothetical protein